MHATLIAEYEIYFQVGKLGEGEIVKIISENESKSLNFCPHAY